MRNIYQIDVMHYRFLLFILLLNLNCTNSFNIKNESDKDPFENTVYRVLDLYNAKNQKSLNLYVNQDLKLYFLFRRGAHDNLSIQDSIEFNHPIPEYLPYEKLSFQKSLPINYNIIPEYSCEKESWNIGKGIYVSDFGGDKKRTEVAKEEKLLELNDWSLEDINQLHQIEQQSKKVVVINEDGAELILYLTLYQGNWFLTGIDRFEVCSA